MSYLVCHMAKYTRGNVAGLQRHNQRENKNYGNDNVDQSKSHLNYDIQNQNNIKYLNKIDQIIKENRTSNKAVRKDAIVYVDTVVGSDKEFFNRLSPEDTSRFFEQSYEYLKEKIGEKNVVSAVVHMDETKGVGGSPHMHFSFVPINEDGTLSAKKKINRNFLREIQDEFPRHMKERGFNIDRGMENSTKRHLEPLEYKKQEIKKDIEETKLQQENIKNRFKTIEKTSESLSKLEKHIKGLTGKLDKIEVKKGLFSDKLTISEYDYSILVNLAKVGEGKFVENIQLKAKVGELERKLDLALNKKSLEDKLRNVKFEEYNKAISENKKLKENFKILEKAVNNLGGDMLDKINAEIKNVLSAEKAMTRSKSFDMER